MPSADAILERLTATANDWRTLAIVWHVLVAGLILTIVTGQRVPNRITASLLVLPVLSVCALAWIAGNPVNSVIFGALSLVLLMTVRRLPSGPVRLASVTSVWAGALLIAFGWVYPHFLEATHWTIYLLAAPTGLLPCPTLATVIGFTVMLESLHAVAWRTTLVGAAIVYGVAGLLWLGVAIDVGLLAGAGALAYACRPRDERHRRRGLEQRSSA
ncbi:MAG TPA: hypothetical protein VGF24_12035 [Vicinamibacterales bacterium]|jgi:hypothetical protein